MNPSSAVAWKPPSNLGMRSLDRSKFTVKHSMVVAKVENPRMLSRIMKGAPKSDLLDLARVPTIVVFGEQKKNKGVLLAPRISDPTKAAGQLHQTTLDLLKEAGHSFERWELELGYDYWTADEILRSILPPELGDTPSGYALVGHIAHLNLHEQHLPYKNIIGEVILDKNQPSVKTVVNKLNNIDSVYRTFEMEVIAGVPEFTVLQHESGCRFKFDFRKVYWNSRLHHEHERLVNLFGENNAICDPMAGVGPFAIPSAKKGNLVFANDLNPESYKAMKENIILNKLNPDILQAFNEDGREFIQNSVRRLHEFREAYKSETIPVAHEATTNSAESANSSPPRSKRKVNRPKLVTIPETFSHYVMNLPASAIEFLDGFRGLYSGCEFSMSDPPLPLIHVHCFYKFEASQNEPTRAAVQESIAKRISKALDYDLSPEYITLHDVRRVAPTKDMYEATFRLPKEVAYMRE